MSRFLVVGVAVAVLQSGCFGSFQLVRGLYGFNRDVSQSALVQEIVFLALVILPVYSLAALGDALIFNTIEFWTGDNPVARRQIVLPDGRLATLESDGDDVVVTTAGETLRLRRSEGRISVLRGTEEVAAVTGTPDGAVVTGADGRVLRRLDASELEGREESAARLAAGVPTSSAALR